MWNNLDSHELTLGMQKKVSVGYHPASFSLFFTEWIRLLQTHVFPACVIHFDARRINEATTLRTFGNTREAIWPRLDPTTIRELVRQRYIRAHVLGQTDRDDKKFVQDHVKAATDYLRVVLGVFPSTVVGRDDPNSFETGLPADLSKNPFAQGDRPLTALLVVLYQVRCNLFHGVKGFRNRSRRDELLTTLGVKILQDLIHALEQDA